MSVVIITANLGHLKAYRLVNTPNRGLKLEMIDEMNFLQAHGRFQEKVTDVAGRFPVAEGSGPMPPMASGEALTAELEIHRRLAKLAAECIERIVERERPKRWHIAAPAEICPAITEAIAPELRKTLLRTVNADLTKVPPEEVLRHFV